MLAGRYVTLRYVMSTVELFQQMNKSCCQPVNWVSVGQLQLLRVAHDYMCLKCVYVFLQSARVSLI